MVGSRETAELPNLSRFFPANLLLLAGMKGSDLFLSLLFLLLRGPPLLDATVSHLLMRFQDAPLMQLALLLERLSPVGIAGSEEGTAIVDVIPNTLPALPVEKRLLIKLASTGGAVPLLQVLVKVGRVSDVVRVVVVTLGVQRRRFLLLQLPG
jgi:hypothetical protein